MGEIEALSLTLIIGLFILVGSLISLLTKNSNKLIAFSIGLAFSIMTLLSVIEIIPEAYELMSETMGLTTSILVILLLIIIGIGILKVLDIFIPDHDHDDKELKVKNLYHIGLISSVALILHNIVEGMAIYTTAISSTKMGIFVGLGVALHNIPLGMAITSFFTKTRKKKSHVLAIILLITLSTLVGGVLMLILNDTNSLTLGILLSVTLGMLIYITIFELLPQIIQTKHKKEAFLGIVFGIVILVLSLFIH